MSKSTQNSDKVRANTPAHLNEAIDRLLEVNVFSFATDGTGLSARIDALNKEWDIERYLELNASMLALLGILLSVTLSWYWLLFPIVILLFLAQHAVQGWCPPLSIFRYFKVRTRREIEQEKYALKALRGDFASVITDLQVDAVRRAQSVFPLF